MGLSPSTNQSAENLKKIAHKYCKKTLLPKMKVQNNDKAENIIK